ncbi:thioesterase II family protein [Spongiimicrobium salis]|uniref:thioesterase II family protein n=1 Tax=Spongiimicrobium salis TaxID=1667022 RepID=UPI00374C8ABC
MKKIKLFCLPYAGGSSVIFSKWKYLIHENVTLVPIELAGRGTRIHEPLYPNIKEAVNDIFNRVKVEIGEGDYAFFGHSMGALLSYELAQKISNQGLKPPIHMFFSGRGAPHVKPLKEKKYHLLNESDFRSKILELGGTPPSFFDHPELLELFLPVLRNDFKLASHNFTKRKVIPLPYDITVFVGKDEDLSAEQIDGWKKHTEKHCQIHYFNGGHFFLNEEVENLVHRIYLALYGDEKNQRHSPEFQNEVS